MKKSILITGSTDGIGKLAAIKLAKDGHQVYLHGRNPAKLAAVITEVKGLTGNENIGGFVADFSDLEDVRKLAKQINLEVETLDVLINNAGVYKSSVNNTKSGVDMRFAVNYLAPYLLTNSLLSLLKSQNESRIINLSSAAQSPVSLKALQGKEQIPSQTAYAQSKLALTMWSFYLANQQKDISVIAVNPGSLLNTNMVKEGFGHFWSSAEKGGNILYDLAISTEYQNVTGKYFDNDKGEEKGSFGKAHPAAYNENDIKELIEITNSILESIVV